MPAPKDPKKYKLWIERLSKSKIGKKVGKDNPMFGKKRPDLAERNRTCIWTKERRDKVGKKHKGKKNPKLSEWNRQQIGEKNYNYGKSPTEETREKISKSNTGKTRTEEQKREQSIRMSGKNHPLYGTKRPDLAERNREKARNGGFSGKNHWNWQDGISFEPYSIEFNRQLKDLIRLRDGYKCQKCGCPEVENVRKLDIHHVDYNKKNCLPSNLISLCRGCNGTVNSNREKWNKFFHLYLDKQVSI